MSVDELSEEEILYAKYKWEFLRRKPEYIEDWKNLQKQLEEKSAEEYRMPEEERVFCKKWRLPLAINPDYTLDEWIEQLSIDVDSTKKAFDLLDESRFRLRLDGPTRISDVFDNTRLHKLILESFSDEPILHSISGTEAFKKFKKQGKITIEIDLNYTKNRLMKEFDRLLTYYQNKYTPTLNVIAKGYPKNKHHFDNYDLYLQVYDLREEGISWSKITNKLELNNIQQARNHYNAAKDLIDKGIDLYVKIGE